MSVLTALQAAGQVPAGLAGKTVNQMMPFAVTCDETWEIVQPAALADQHSIFAYHSDLESAELSQYLCALIPRSAAAVGRERLPASSTWY